MAYLSPLEVRQARAIRFCDVSDEENILSVIRRSIIPSNDLLDVWKKFCSGLHSISYLKVNFFVGYNQGEKSMSKIFQAHQGDVYVRQVLEIPSGAERVEIKGDVILAHGETTGHAHRIGSQYGAVMFRAGDEGGTFLQIKDGAAITHEEHATITLPAGLYEVTVQSQYTPEAIMNVQD